jgi:hypothetical protein
MDDQNHIQKGHDHSHEHHVHGSLNIAEQNNFLG